MQVIEVIPYKSFKERVKIVKSFIGKAKVEVFEDYVLIDRIEGGNINGLF